MDDTHLIMFMMVILTMMLMIMIMTLASWEMLTRLVARARCTVSGWVGTKRDKKSRPKKIRLR